jgi:hypothetical protein
MGFRFLIPGLSRSLNMSIRPTPMKTNAATLSVTDDIPSSSKKKIREMIWLIALLSSLKLALFDEKNSQWRLNKDAQLPEILRVDPREKSFSAQDYTWVRPPYGANPNFARTVADVTMIDTPKYQQSYQENIRNVQILTEDYRLPDAQFFTPSNNYTNYHLTEAGISKINEYWNLRRRSHV